MCPKEADPMSRLPLYSIYVYHDNQSVILLETNGTRSIGKGSRHIRIKYFFITDEVKDKELKISYQENYSGLLHQTITGGPVIYP